MLENLKPITKKEGSKNEWNNYGRGYCLCRLRYFIQNV